MFGRPIVKAVRHPATFEVELTNDQGQTYRFSEEQFTQMRMVRGL